MDLVTRTPPDLSSLPERLQWPWDVQVASQRWTGRRCRTFPAIALLPAHSDSDLNFAIQKSTETMPLVRDTLTYVDWNGAEWSAQTYAGWFVQTCKSHRKCTQSDSLNANIRYVDWSGTNWTASSSREINFISTKNKPDPTDKQCPADQATGVSPGLDFSKCISYLSTSIPVKGPGWSLGTGLAVGVEAFGCRRLSPASPPCRLRRACRPARPSLRPAIQRRRSVMPAVNRDCRRSSRSVAFASGMADFNWHLTAIPFPPNRFIS